MLTPQARHLIADARERKLWSQQKLAEEANVSLWTVSDLETGRNTSPRKRTVYAIAEALGLDADAVLFAPEPEEAAS